MHYQIVSFFLLFLFSVTSLVQGQDIEHRPETKSQKGQFSISPTLGVRAPGSSIFNAKAGNFTLPAVLYIDYGLNDMWSIGLIGGVRVFQCESCSGDVNGTFYSAGVRVNGHVLPILNQFTDFDIQQEKVDVYLSLMGGAELNSSHTMIPRLSLGARYRVLPTLSILGEIGTGFLSMANVGATVHL